MRARLSFLLGGVNSLEFNILPGATSLAQNVRAAVHRDDLKVVLHTSNLLRSQFSEFRGERDEATIAILVGEDAGAERLCSFLIDECTDLHTLTRCECQQRARVYNLTHTNF